MDWQCNRIIDDKNFIMVDKCLTSNVWELRVCVQPGGRNEESFLFQIPAGDITQLRRLFESAERRRDGDYPKPLKGKRKIAKLMTELAAAMLE